MGEARCFRAYEALMAGGTPALPASTSFVFFMFHLGLLYEANGKRQLKFFQRQPFILPFTSALTVRPNITTEH